MARKKAPEKHNEMTGMMRWLLTYADLVTLLLIVFIVLFSISNQDAEKFKNLAQYLRAAFGGVLQQGPTFLEGQGDRVIPDLFQRISAAVSGAAGAGEGAAGAKVYQNERGIVVSLMTDRVLFDSGSVELKPEMQQILDALGGPLRETDRSILVEGHTDDRPVRGGRRYTDNMELSTLRACNVVRYLIETGEISPKRMSAAGYAEYRPVVPNRDEASRQRNRRIDIVILKGNEGT